MNFFLYVMGKTLGMRFKTKDLCDQCLGRRNVKVMARLSTSRLGSETCNNILVIIKKVCEGGVSTYSITSSMGGPLVIEDATEVIREGGLKGAGGAMTIGERGGGPVSIAEALSPFAIPVSRSCHLTTISIPFTSTISSTPGCVTKWMGNLPLTICWWSQENTFPAIVLWSFD